MFCGKQRILSIGIWCMVQLLGVRLSVQGQLSLCYKGQLEITVLTLSKSIVLSPHTVLHDYRRDLRNFLHCYTQYSKYVTEGCYGNWTLVKYSWIITYFLTSGKDMRQNQFCCVFFLTTYKKNYQPPHNLLWYCKAVHIWAPFDFANLLWTKGGIVLEHRWEADST